MFMMNITFYQFCTFNLHSQIHHLYFHRKQISTHFLTTNKNLTFFLSPTVCHSVCVCVCMCVCVCVCGERERESEREWERERELYPFPNLPTPKYICQYSKLSVSVFSDLWSDYLSCFVLLFFRMHHQSIKTKKCQRTIFLSSIFYFKNSVRTHIFNKTDALQNWHTMTLGRLYFVNVC